jgi:pimeloyl-ACP methyl ester carboxylesterase
MATTSALASTHRHVLCATPSGLHRLGYYEWGAPDCPRVVICVHGLTRCARDFEPLARALAGEYRVILPDMPGRGTSDRLKNPNEYQISTYVADCVTLIARSGAATVDWIGTSMGGLIGMALAALEHAPIRRLVLNDAGPVVTGQSLNRIAQYVGRVPRFPDFAAAEQYIRFVSAPFGPHSDDEWRFLTEIVMRAQPDGSFLSHYDPAIAVPFNAQLDHQDVVMWPLYDAIRCPTLVVRGEQSDLLTRATTQEMARRGPRARVVEFAGVGHAPTLMHADQIAVVRDFLLEP